MKTTLLIVLLLNIPTVNAICSAFLHASGLKPIGLGGEEVVCFLCVLLAGSSAFHSISLEDIFVTCFVSPSPLAIVAASINGMEGIACEMSMLHAVFFSFYFSDFFCRK